MRSAPMDWPQDNIMVKELRQARKQQRVETTDGRLEVNLAESILEGQWETRREREKVLNPIKFKHCKISAILRPQNVAGNLENIQIWFCPSGCFITGSVWVFFHWKHNVQMISIILLGFPCLDDRACIKTPGSYSKLGLPAYKGWSSKPKALIMWNMEGRIPKKLVTGASHEGYPQLKFKDVCKHESMPHQHGCWEEAASDRAEWWTVNKAGMKPAEEIKTKTTQQKSDSSRREQGKPDHHLSASTTAAWRMTLPG